MLRDRVEQQTLTSGSGPYTLDLTVTGKKAVASVFANGAKVRYVVVGGAAWEQNEGLLDTGVSPPQLSRARLINSSTGSAIAWPDASAKTLFVDAGAELFGPLGNQLITAAVGGTVNAITLSTNIETPLYADGMAVEFEAAGAPTANVTAALNALPPKPVLYRSADQICPGDWEATARLRLIFDLSLDAWLLPWRRPGWNKGADIASASTLVKPANARDGSYHRVTGATAVANLWTGAPDGIEHEFEVVTGFTFTNGANLICPGGNIIAAAGDRLNIRHIGSNVWAITRYTRADGKALVDTLQAQILASRFYAEIATNADLAGNIPGDDTAPSSGEGTQILSIASVVVTGTQRVRLRFQCFGEQATAGVAMTGAIFRGTTCVQVGTFDVGAGGFVDGRPLGFEVEEAPGAGTFTYSVRVGAASGIMRINGSSTGRMFGGAAKATLVIDVLNP